jgi:hypothetical protein
MPAGETTEMEESPEARWLRTLSITEAESPEFREIAKRMERQWGDFYSPEKVAERLLGTGVPLHIFGSSDEHGPAPEKLPNIPVPEYLQELPYKLHLEQKKVIELQDRVAELGKSANALDGVVEQLERANKHLEANEARGKASDARRALREAKEQAAARGAEFRRQVGALATGITGLTNGIVGVINASKGGNPFAISAASLDLASAIVGTAGALAGPYGAAAGALLGAVLGMVSTILKQFLPAEPPLLQRIEALLRQIGAENTGHDLHSAVGAIWAFEKAADQAKDGSMTYDEIIALLNPVEGNTMRDLRRSDGWLLEPNNLRTAPWTDLLAVRLDAYKRLKLAYARWLPKLQPGETQKLLRIVDVNDPAELEFVEKIKPAARARGRVWDQGRGYIAARESPLDWTFFNHMPAEAFSVAHAGGAPSAHPEAVLFSMWSSKHAEVEGVLGTVGGRSSLAFTAPPDSSEAVRKAAKHPFFKKDEARMVCIDWPYKQGQDWTPVAELAGCYDVWATPAREQGAVDVYSATGPTIRRYRHGLHTQARLTQQWESKPTPGYTVGTVRVTAQPKLAPGEVTVSLEGIEWVVYGLCEVTPGASVVPRPSVHGTDHFEIMACYSHGAQGYVFPPWEHQDGVSPAAMQPWATVAGISADDEYLWVFRAGTIAFATHSEVRRAARDRTDVGWTLYDVPRLGEGEPLRRLFKGVRDLTYCADGSLTIVYHDASAHPHQRYYGPGLPELLWTSTPQIRKRSDGRREMVIEATTGSAHRGTATTHGWTILDPNEVVRRVHKTPIVCWPVLEGLGKTLGPKPTAPRVVCLT